MKLFKRKCDDVINDDVLLDKIIKLQEYGVKVPKELMVGIDHVEPMDVDE